MRYIYVRDSDGAVLKTWMGDGAPPDADDGHTRLEHATATIGQRLINGVLSVAPPRSISVYDFMLRFTRAERSAIRAAVAGGNPMIADFFELLNAKQPDGVNLDAPMLIAGLGYLSGVTVDGETLAEPILAQGRAAQIRA